MHRKGKGAQPQPDGSTHARKASPPVPISSLTPSPTVPRVAGSSGGSRTGAFVPGSVGYALVSAAVNAVLDRLGFPGGADHVNSTMPSPAPGRRESRPAADRGTSTSTTSSQVSATDQFPASSLVDPAEIADLLRNAEHEGDLENDGEWGNSTAPYSDQNIPTPFDNATPASRFARPSLSVRYPSEAGKPCVRSSDTRDSGVSRASAAAKRLVVDLRPESPVEVSGAVCARTTDTEGTSLTASTHSQATKEDEEDSSNYLPISAVAELVYCPRSFYYRMVEGAEDENADLIEGKLQEEKRAKRRQFFAESRTQVRSVRLVSRRLGLVGIADAIEEGDSVGLAPVEFKKGSLGHHLSHDIQVCLQAMALEEMYDIVVPKGYVYYAESRTRREVVIDDDLRTLAVRAVEDARRILESRDIPLPAVDARCGRCSLRSRCMPCETSYLKGQPDAGSGGHVGAQAGGRHGAHSGDRSRGPGIAPLGHPVPSYNLGRILYVDASGAYLRCSGQRFVVCAGDKVLKEVPAINVDEILMCGRANWTASAMHLALDRGVPITLMSCNGRLLGRAVPPLSKNGALRSAQYRQFSDERVQLTLARQLVAAKIANMRTVLMRYRRSAGRSSVAAGGTLLSKDPTPVALAALGYPSQAQATEVSVPVGALFGEVDRAIDNLQNYVADAEVAQSMDSLRGVEGNAARVYFRGLAAFLRLRHQDAQRRGREGGVEDQAREAFAFNDRNRRPPRDPVNAMLSFGYAMLCSTVLNCIDAIGLDPYIGFYHTAKYARPCLALDLMEEFRACLVDTLVLTLVNKRMVRVEDFDIQPGGCFLARRGRAIMVAAYQARMQQEITHPIFNYRVSYRRIIELQARLLAKYISGELDRYYPFLAR